MDTYQKLQKCVKSIKQRTSFEPKVALILGSGLGDYAEDINIVDIVDYKDVEGFPVSTVSGHKGRFIFGYVDKVPVVIMQGRIHYYEGYEISDVVLGARVMGSLGAKVLFVTNAAGGINFDFRAGDFMVIKDQISSFFPSPLVGKNYEELGTRFPDMSHAYDEELSNIILKTGKKLGIELRTGTYIQLTGPSFETPAEIRMCRILGADAVGMSTACEVTAANHMGMRVCGISCISNLAAGMTENRLSNEEVYETAVRVSGDFKRLITESIKEIAEVL